MMNKKMLNKTNEDLEMYMLNDDVLETVFGGGVPLPIMNKESAKLGEKVAEFFKKIFS